MEKRISKVFMLFCLCAVLSIGFFKGEVFAAGTGTELGTGVERVAYIDSGNHLVLRISSFSKTGYTYKVTGNGKTLSGSVQAGTTEIKIDISGIYAAAKTYSLQLTAKDSGNYIKANYYTGAGISGASVSSSNKTITSKWTTGKPNNYTGFYLGIYNESGDLKKITSGTVDSRTATSVTANGGSAAAGKYASYIIGTKKSGGKDYYGYGTYKQLTYLTKVLGLSAKPDTKKITLSWNPVKEATGYAVYYKKPGTSRYTLLKKVVSTSYTAKNLLSGKNYTFKVRAYAKGANSAFSAEVTKTVPKVPGKVTGVQFTLTSEAKFAVTWDLTKDATSYVVYAKEKGGSYKEMGETASKMLSLAKLDVNKTYSIIVYAKKNSYRSDKHSKALTVVPAAFIKKNKTRILASKVRTIKYTKNGYTTKKYSTEIKEAYVNYNGFSSKTKYLIWASLYTQQASIFKGYKGHWKMFKTFTIGSGKKGSGTPRGTFALFQKDKQWNRSWGKTMYCSHFYKKASFHTRPLYRNGKVRDKVLGMPWTTGCIRCLTEDAIYIYKYIPLKTTVRVW